MSEVGLPVDSGLLLYLREGVMKEIQASHHERRDLLLLRNEMAHYLSQQNGSSERNRQRDAAAIDAFQMNLPEPINHRNACANCPYGALCSVYVKRDKKMWSSLEKDHPLKEMAPLVTMHLTEAHVEYFCHWVGLLSLEDREAMKGLYLFFFVWKKIYAE